MARTSIRIRGPVVRGRQPLRQDIRQKLSATHVIGVGRIKPIRDGDLADQLNEAAASNAILYVYDTYEDQTGLVNRYFAR